MLDTTSTEATLRLERDTARIEVARLHALLTAQAANHEAATQGYRDQASRDHSELVTVQLENEQLRAEIATLKIANDNLGRLAAEAIDASFDAANATLDRLATELGHDDYDHGELLDEDEAYFRGPTPANEKFVSAMAAMEPDDDEIAEAMELADREEQAWRNVDDNASLGLAQGAV